MKRKELWTKKLEQTNSFLEVLSEAYNTRSLTKNEEKWMRKSLDQRASLISKLTGAHVSSFKKK